MLDAGILVHLWAHVDRTCCVWQYCFESVWQYCFERTISNIPHNIKPVYKVQRYSVTTSLPFWRKMRSLPFLFNILLTACFASCSGPPGFRFSRISKLLGLGEFNFWKFSGRILKVSLEKRKGAFEASKFGGKFGGELLEVSLLFWSRRRQEEAKVTSVGFKGRVPLIRFIFRAFQRNL